MGGEPLCEENKALTYLVISNVKNVLPDVKVYIWTGYYLEQLNDPASKKILELTDYLIDGPFILAERDITLPMRGSRNQRIIDLSEKI